jgi:hypothetical protein
VLAFGAYKAVLHRGMAHRWNEDRSKIGLSDLFTIRLAKCIAYAFVERIECTPEGRSFAHKVKNPVPYDNAEGVGFLFVTDWIHAVYREVLECFYASGDDPDVSVLGHILRKCTSVTGDESMHVSVSALEWPVVHLLQTMLTGIWCASEWMTNHHGAHSVKFAMHTKK